MSKLLGAVITHSNLDMVAIMAMLSGHLRDKVEMIYYSEPHEINPERLFDVIVLSDNEDIQRTLTILNNRKHGVPPIIHLTRNTLDYDILFPHITIVPIVQAPLDRLDVTLQLDAFERVVTQLYHKKINLPVL